MVNIPGFKSHVLCPLSLNCLLSYSKDALGIPGVRSWGRMSFLELWMEIQFSRGNAGHVMLIIGSESQCLSWLVKKKIIDAG